MRRTRVRAGTDITSTPMMTSKPPSPISGTDSLSFSSQSFLLVHSSSWTLFFRTGDWSVRSVNPPGIIGPQPDPLAGWTQMMRATTHAYRSAFPPTSSPPPPPSGLDRSLFLALFAGMQSSACIAPDRGRWPDVIVSKLHSSGRRLKTLFGKRCVLCSRQPVSHWWGLHIYRRIFSR